MIVLLALALYAAAGIVIAAASSCSASRACRRSLLR
jgi:hypothetical protein